MYESVPITGCTVVNLWPGLSYLSVYQIHFHTARACLLCNEAEPMLHPNTRLVFDDQILCCLSVF